MKLVVLMMIRRDVIYTGRVQGVGFRWTTNHIAKDFDVVGTVENRNDGTVYMVVEGLEREVDAFMKEIGSRMALNVKDTEIRQGFALGNLDDFHVNY